MPSENRLTLKHADQPGYTPDIECYLKHGGYEALKKAALDPYIAVREAYAQHRENKIKRK